MNKFQSTRREFLKAAGLGGIMLAASPLSVFSRPSGKPIFWNAFPLNTFEWTNLFSTHTQKSTIKTGDHIRFLPELEIDGFSPIADTAPSFFNNIFLNVYEFSFRPIAKHAIPLEPMSAEAKRELDLEDIPDEMVHG